MRLCAAFLWRSLEVFVILVLLILGILIVLRILGVLGVLIILIVLVIVLSVVLVLLILPVLVHFDLLCPDGRFLMSYHKPWGLQKQYVLL